MIGFFDGLIFITVSAIFAYIVLRIRDFQNGV